MLGPKGRLLALTAVTMAFAGVSPGAALAGPIGDGGGFGGGDFGGGGDLGGGGDF